MTPKNRIVCWFSCGAASAVATKLAIAENNKRDNPQPLTVVYTKVQEEHPDNDRFLKECQDWFGVEIKILINQTFNGSIYEVFKTNSLKYGATRAPCSRKLKKQLREKYQRMTDTHVFGFTADELIRHSRFIDANNDVKTWDILIDKNLRKNDCLAMVARAGIELPVMYKMGYDHNNCIGCVKGGMGYWNKIRVDFPDVFERMAKLERIKNETLFKDCFLDELDPNRGHGMKEPNIECSVFCMVAEDEYS